MKHRNRVAAVVAALAGSSLRVVAVRASRRAARTRRHRKVRRVIGAGEGAVTILDWPGYAESGKNDPKVDWVTPFEKATGCKATVKDFSTSDEAFNLFKTGEYDVVSSSGDATLRMVADSDAAVINTKLVTNWNDLDPLLKTKPWNSVNGVVYGVPHGWGANLLMYNKNVVKPAPDSWGAAFDANSPYKGKVTGYDSPIFIADGALYLMKTQPDLKITDPYALDDTQFNAVVDLMKQQKPIIGEYWSDYLKEQDAFTQGQHRARHDVADHDQLRAGRQGVAAGRRDPPEGRIDRVVRQLDDPRAGEASELCVHVDQLDHEARHPGAGRRVVR